MGQVTEGLSLEHHGRKAGPQGCRCPLGFRASAEGSGDGHFLPGQSGDTTGSALPVTRIFTTPGVENHNHPL